MSDDQPGVGLKSWWVIHGETLLSALQACADGEDPDMVYTELYANSETEQCEDEEDGDDDT